MNVFLVGTLTGVVGPHDFGVLCEQLQPCASKWETIASGLRFTNDEINTIRADPIKAANAPQSYLGAVLDEWFHWAPGDARGSKDKPTLEALRTAVSKAGYGNIAAKLTLSESSQGTL